MAGAISLGIMTTSPEATRKTAALLESVWQRNLPTLKTRLDVLAFAASQVPLTPEIRREAAATVHKIAGSVGMFGYEDATDIARRLEVLFDPDQTPTPDPGALASMTTTLREILLSSEK